MAITLSGSLITIALIAGGKGSSASNPFTIEDLYQASQDGSWGIQRTGEDTTLTYSYTIPQRITIAANTYFKAEFCNIIFCPYNSGIQVLNNYNTSYITFNKVSILYRPQGPLHTIVGIAYIYNCTFTDCYVSGFYVMKLYSGCSATRTYFNTWINFYFGTTFNNCTFNGTAGYEMFGEAAIVRSLFYGFLRSVYMPNNSQATYRDLTFLHPTYLFQLSQQTAGYGDNVVINLVDCYSVASYVYYTPGSTAGKVATLNLKSTFKFIGEAGVYATVYDKNNEVVFESILSGATEAEITYKKYYSVTPNLTTTDYQPLKIILSKVGYQTVTIENINIISGQPTSIRYSLIPVPATSPTISSLQIANPGVSNNDGSITIIAESGTQPYLYSINSGDFQEGNVFPNLEEGSYSVSVKDANDLVDSVSGIALKKTNPTIYFDRKPALTSINKQIPVLDLKPVLQPVSLKKATLC